jgi:hypothetical protein
VLFYDLKSGLISIEYAAGVTPVEADTIYYLAASPASTEREQETPWRSPNLISLFEKTN